MRSMNAASLKRGSSLTMDRIWSSPSRPSTCCIAAAIQEESTPPDSNTPTGTSLRSRSRTLSMKVSRISSKAGGVPSRRISSKGGVQ